MPQKSKAVEAPQAAATVGKIAKPGIYRISMENYHGQPCEGPSVSSSELRTLFIDSPAHYWCKSSLNPEAEEDDGPQKSHFVLGRAAHHLLLGEEAFSTLFILRPTELDGKPWQGNRTECKRWLVAQAKAGRTVVTAEQIKAIRGMARSLSEHPLVRAGILNGDIEQSMFWQDRKTGIWLKSRPDAIPNNSGDFADLKTTSNFGFDLDRDVSNYRYDMQAALAGMGSRAVLGREMESFSFVFVESKPPHAVEVLTLHHEDIDRAERDLRAAIDTFDWCLRNKNWFGPAGTQLDARYVHIGDWAQKTAEARRSFLQKEIERAEIATPQE